DVDRRFPRVEVGDLEPLEQPHAAHASVPPRPRTAWSRAASGIRPVNFPVPGRGSSEAEQAAHNRCVAGSIPAPATRRTTFSFGRAEEGAARDGEAEVRAEQAAR